MTMYLPNDAVSPTGYEAAEFIEEPTFAPPKDARAGTPEVGDEDGETGLRPS
jgi:hypothetical protein